MGDLRNISVARHVDHIAVDLDLGSERAEILLPKSTASAVAWSILAADSGQALGVETKLVP